MPHKPKRRHAHEQAEDASDRGPGERLQKVLAAAGVGSRRDCEELIREGRVEVDRHVVTELGTRVNPLAQEIRVDGEALRQPQRLYYVVNKPVGVVTTNHDPSGRARVIDLVPTDERVFAVGRLDRSSEGLILVTNDGEFANRITHPRYGVEKTYQVRVAGAPDQRQLARLKKGVHLAEGFARAQSITVKSKHGQSTDLVIVLNEGRNREIRRILARVGHKVLAIRRVAIGPIKLADLPTGGWRRLMPAEVESLLRVAKERRRAGKGRKQERVPGSGFRVQGGEESKVQSPRSEVEAEGPYLQKQALMAEPLSLDDLLRDDMDEGPIAGDGSSESVAEETGEFSAGGQPKGGVIDYGEEPSPAKKPREGVPRKRQQAHRQENQRQGKRADVNERPREDFGRKRSGKRVFGRPETGGGPAGAKTGKLHFRHKRKKKGQAVPPSEGVGRGRRGKPAKVQQHGGKRKGRR